MEIKDEPDEVKEWDLPLLPRARHSSLRERNYAGLQEGTIIVSSLKHGGVKFQAGKNHDATVKNKAKAVIAKKQKDITKAVKSAVLRAIVRELGNIDAENAVADIIDDEPPEDKSDDELDIEIDVLQRALAKM